MIFHLVHIKTHASSYSKALSTTEEVPGLVSVPAGILNALVEANIRPSLVTNFVSGRKENSFAILLYSTIVHCEGCCTYLILATFTVKSYL